MARTINNLKTIKEKFELALPGCNAVLSPDELSLNITCSHFPPILSHAFSSKVAFAIYPVSSDSIKIHFFLV